MSRSFELPDTTPHEFPAKTHFQREIARQIADGFERGFMAALSMKGIEIQDAFLAVLKAQKKAIADLQDEIAALKEGRNQ